MRTTLVTATSIIFLGDALLWAIGVAVPLRHAFVHRTLPRIGGIRALSGPFESLGMDAFIVAGIVFMVVSSMKILVGYWLWQARLDGAVLALILTGLSAVFWYGFELPLGWLGGIIEVVLLMLVWANLKY